MATVGSAQIEFEADVSGVSDELVSKMETALSKVTSIVESAMTEVEGDYERAGAALGTATADGARNAQDYAERSASGIERAYEAAAAATSEALSDLDTSGFLEVERAAEKAGESIGREIGEGTAEAESKLGRLGASFSTLGGRISGWAQEHKAQAGIALAGIGALAATTVDYAAQAEQSYGAVESVFGQHAQTIIDASTLSADAVGLSGRAYRELSSTTGAMLKNMGLPMEEVTAQTQGLVTVGADLAATYGGSTAEAMEAIGSLLRGEVDPIERYGVSIKQADIQARLAAQGLDGLEGEALKMATANTTLAMLTEQAGGAVGQFARETDTAAGKQAIATARIQDAREEIGTALLPIFAQLMDVLGKVANLVGDHPRLFLALAGAFTAVTTAVFGLAVIAPIFTAISGAAAAAGMSMRAYATAQIAALAPALAVVAGIGLLVGAFVVLWNRSEAFRGFWIGLWESIKGAVAPVVDWIKAQWESLTGWLSGAVGSLRALIVEGDYTGAFADAFGIEEDHPAIAGILRIRDAITGLWDLVVGGDFTSALGNAFNIEEDHPFVNTIMTIRDTLGQLPELAQGVADILFRGDFTGLPFGLEEDSPVVNLLFGIRDAVLAAWESLQNLWSTLVDVGAVLAGAWWESAKSVFSAIADVAMSMWEAFKSVAGAVWDLLQALAPVLLPVLKVIGGIIGGVVVAAFFTLMGAVRLLAGLFSTLARVVGWVAQNVLVPLIGVISNVVSWLVDKFAGALSWVADLLGSVFSGIGPALSEAWQWIQDTWTSLTTWLGEAWAGLQGLWETYGQPVVDWIIQAFQWLWEKVQLVGRLIGAAWEVLMTALGKAWEAWGQPVVDWVVGAFQRLWGGLQVIFGWLRTGWEFLWAGIQVAWAAVGQPVVDGVVWVFTNFWNGLQVIFGWVQSGWNLLWAGVRWVYDTIIAPVIGFIVAGFQGLWAGLQTIFGWISTGISTVGGVMRGLWSDYVQPMIDWVVDGFNRMLDTIRGWKDNVIGWFSDAGSWLWDAGKNLVQGLIDGAQSLLKNIGEFFLDVLPDWVKDPFKRALGIESPSTVFAAYGRNVGEGLAAGIASMRDPVREATQGLSDEVSSVPVMVPPIGAPVASVAPPVAATAAPVVPPLGPDVMEGSTAAAGEAYTGMATTVAQQTNEVVVPALAAVDSSLAGTAANFLAQTGLTISPAWASMARGLLSQANGVIGPVFSQVQSGLATTAGLFPSQVNGVVTPAWQNMGSQINSVKVGTIDPAFAGIQGGLQNVVGAFANGARDVGTHMENMRKSTADPVRFTMNTIFSDGLVEMWNGVSDMIGTEKMGKRYAAFASGGFMPGYTPGQDVHRFFSPTGGILDLSGGEPVLRPEAGRVLGTDWVHGINEAAASGGTRGVQRFLGAFAKGGFIPGGYAGGFAPGGVIYGGGFGVLSPITASHAAWVGRHFPDLFTLTSAWRHTDSGHHSRGEASDWQARDGQFATQRPTAASKALARALYATFPTAAELIHWPEDGWRNHQHGQAMNFGAATNLGHQNHVHFATLGPIGSDAAGLDSIDIDWNIDWDAMLQGMVAEQLGRVDASAASANFPGAVGQVPARTWESMRAPTLDAMATSMKDYWSSMGAGSGADRWRPLAMQALARHGYNPADYIEAMLQQIQIESSGDPGAVNNWDINAMRGDPSGGLLQVIGATYRRVRAAYPEAFEGLPDDRMFPLTNLTAGVGAVRMDWGGPGNRWPTTGGYEHGGLMGEGEGLFHKTAFEPERVLSPRQTRSFEELVDVLGSTSVPQIRDAEGGTAGSYGGQTTKQVHVTQNIVTPDPKGAADEVEDRLTKLLV